MQAPDSQVIRVKLHGGRASFRFADGSEQIASESELAKSSLLLHALSQTADGEEVALPVPQAMLRSWLQWISLEDSCSEHYEGSTSRLVKYLKVGEAFTLQMFFVKCCLCTVGNWMYMQRYRLRSVLL